MSKLNFQCLLDGHKFKWCHSGGNDSITICKQFPNTLSNTYLKLRHQSSTANHCTADTRLHSELVQNVIVNKCNTSPPYLQILLSISGPDDCTHKTAKIKTPLLITTITLKRKRIAASTTVERGANRDRSPILNLLHSKSHKISNKPTSHLTTTTSNRSQGKSARRRQENCCKLQSSSSRSLQFVRSRGR